MTNSHGYLSAVVIKKDGTQKQLALYKHNVLTNGGRDQMHVNCYTSTSLSGRGFNYIALTQDTTQTVQASETILTGEITTNGLGRAFGTATHTNGTNSSTVENTFTATGSFTDVVRSATFNASSAGTMGHFAAFSSGSGTMISGDTLKVTWTNNLSGS